MMFEKHQARMAHYDGSYVWLVDSRVIKQLGGDEDVEVLEVA